MFILLVTVLAVMLNDGTIVEVKPARMAVIDSFKSLKDCEDARQAITAMMAQDLRPGEEDTFFLTCKAAKQIQRREP